MIRIISTGGEKILLMIYGKKVYLTKEQFKELKQYLEETKC